MPLAKRLLLLCSTGSPIVLSPKPRSISRPGFTRKNSGQAEVEVAAAVRAVEPRAVVPPAVVTEAMVAASEVAAVAVAA